MLLKEERDCDLLERTALVAVTLMDYRNEDKPCNWQRGDYYIEKDPNLKIPGWHLNGMRQNDLSYMFDKTTPVKACGDLAYHASFSENMNKEVEVCRETSSQLKRRRMLQFNTQAVDPPTSREELSSEFLESNVNDSNRDDPEVSQWDSGCSGFLDNVSVSCYESLDQSPEGWISECFNDSTMQFDYDDMNFSRASDFHIDLTEFCDMPSGYEANKNQQNVTQPSRKIVFKGKKSYIRTPTKLASSVAYPFAIIKPCGVLGDVTLKDINQRIRTPPPSKSKTNEEDPSASYPSSAFSGKPVVVKTKIHTEGGRGSITILRTKG